MNRSARFTVIDFETTGVFPRADRVIEVGLVTLDGDLEPIAEYETLINPDRDLGPTYIHGIGAQQLVDAPTFDRVARAILEAIGGAYVVGHNVRFDIGFLRAELARMGIDLPAIPALCTMEMSGQCGGSISGKLTHCCAAEGIRVDGAHSAIADARATAALFRRYALRSGGPEAWVGVGAPVHLPMETTPPSAAPVTRAQAVAAEGCRRSPLIDLVNRMMPSAKGTGDIVPYLDLLDRVLEDRIVHGDEGLALFELASEWNLNTEDIRRAHRTYFDGLVDAYWVDNVFTESEIGDLKTVAGLLGISPDDAAKAMLPRSPGPVDAASVAELAPPAVAPTLEEMRGKKVCFTGQFTCLCKGEYITRALAQQLAAEAGLEVQKNVTKKTDFLVAADPHSMSGKAKKARQYGIPIMAEPVFWRRLGLQVG